MIDRIGQRFVAGKAIDEEDAPVFMECAGDPDGHGESEAEIGGISNGDVVHDVSNRLVV